MNFLSRLTHPARMESSELETPEQIDAFIDSRALEYPTALEDDFVRRALALGLDSGMILDVGTRVGLIPLKILWQNEAFYAIGIDRSGAMIERARATAAAWDLAERAFFRSIGQSKEKAKQRGLASATLPRCGEGSAARSASDVAELGRGEPHTGTGLFAPPPSCARPSAKLRYLPVKGEVMPTAPQCPSTYSQNVIVATDATVEISTTFAATFTARS